MPSANVPSKRHLTDGPGPELGPAPVLIDVDRIDENPLNPRDELDDDDAELRSLAASLGGSNLIHPIHVEESDGSGRYRLIAGERRWRAAKLAGWRTIPAFLCRGLDQAARVKLLVDENLERKDLSPIGLAKALALLHRPKTEGGAGMSQEAIAKRYGKSQGSWASNVIKLLRLPETWQRRIAAAELGMRQGKALAAYAERADVLGAVELDYKRNSDEWETADRFDRRLAFIVERLDGLKKGAAGPSMSQESAAAADDDSTDSAPPTLPLHRRSAPVDHSLPEPMQPADDDGGLSSDDIARVLDSVFDVLDRLKPYELGPLSTYIDRRSRGIEGPEARLPSRRAGGKAKA